jgi:hypothetical protein
MNKKVYITYILCLFFLVACKKTVFPRYVLKGTLIDSVTRQPIETKIFILYKPSHNFSGRSANIQFEDLTEGKSKADGTFKIQCQGCRGETFIQIGYNSHVNLIKYFKSKGTSTNLGTIELK